MTGPFADQPYPLPRPPVLRPGAVKHTRRCDPCEHGHHDLCAGTCGYCGAPCSCLDPVHEDEPR